MIDSNFFDNFGPFSLAEIIDISKSKIHLLNKQTVNPASILFQGIAPLSTAQSNEISILNNEKYLNELRDTKAGACFMSEKHIKYAPDNLILLISDNPYKSYALTSNKFHPGEVFIPWISPNAVIDKTAIIGKNCRIEHNVIIGSNVIIGNNCKIGAGSYIGRGVEIGDNCVIFPSVTIGHTIMENNNIVHTGCRIGQDGFGFASDKYGHYKLPQLGRVIIGNNVEIGANTCIDRGSGNDTIISDSRMIDNLVQIGHNVKIGKACIIVAQAGIAGSTVIGDFVVIGGQVGIAGHLKIGSFVKIAAASGVTKDIEPNQTYGGYPAVPINMWHRQSITLKKLVTNKEKNNE